MVSFQGTDSPTLRECIVSSPVSLALSRPRRGLGQASPSLKAPRLQALGVRYLFHQHNRKGKIVMINISRYIELVLGSFEAAYCQLSVAWCDVDAFRAAEEGAWVGVKPDLQRRHRFGPAYKGNVF